MEEQLISFETAKLAKEKGFNIHCRNCYDEDSGEPYENEDFPYNSFSGSLFAPPQSLLQKWLREEHKIHISINYHDYNFVTHVINMKNDEHLYFGVNETYEKALESCLFETLKLIKL